jgi:hypothetical protein
VTVTDFARSNVQLLIAGSIAELQLSPIHTWFRVTVSVIGESASNEAEQIEPPTGGAPHGSVGGKKHIPHWIPGGFETTTPSPPQLTVSSYGPGGSDG